MSIQNPLFPAIENAIQALTFEAISTERKNILAPLMAFIQEKKDKNEAINLNFICTHNSRRSHLSQVWAQALAVYYGVDFVTTYSGGTEATALFPSAAEALRQSGFEIKALSADKNPVYAIKLGRNLPAVIGFSKTFDDDFNPQSNFAAILTCSSADQGCPFIAGAEKRIPITFEDPKAFDNTPLQAAKYLERSLQIATELSYVFSQIKK